MAHLGQCACAVSATNSSLSFSVVIYTDGRRSVLKLTLDCLQYLDYENFEVCVVYGPTYDGTKEYLASCRVNDRGHRIDRRPDAAIWPSHPSICHRQSQTQIHVTSHLK